MGVAWALSGTLYIVSEPPDSAQILSEGQSTVANKVESIGMQFCRVSSYVNTSPLRSPSGRLRKAGCSKILSRFHSMTAQSNCCRQLPETVKPAGQLAATVRLGRHRME